MVSDSRLPMYRRQLEKAPDPEDTSAEDEYTACLNYITQIQENTDTDGAAFLDSDPRPNFSWSVVELHGPRLEICVSHAELPSITLRWPHADIHFVTVREQIPDIYYTSHEEINLNYYTVCILDFSPYGRATPDQTDDSSDSSPDPEWTDTTRHRVMYAQTNHPDTNSFGA